MAISLLSLGDAAAAEREIAHAGELAPPSARGLVELLVALVLQRTGRLDAALSAYGRSLTRLRRDGDHANVARLLLNRGTLRAYQGAFQAALDDLGESERLATELDLWVLVAMAAHNLGFALGRRGDVPAALAAFDRAEAAYASQGDPPRLVAALASDRCEVFLTVGLARDATLAAERALTLLGDAGDATHRSEARLLLARARLAQSDLDGARREAEAAAAAFRSARRTPWAAVADYVAMQAEIRATEDVAVLPSGGMLTRTRRIARLLEVQGWPVEAMHVRTFLARVALALGRPEVARRELVDVEGARAHGLGAAAGGGLARHRPAPPRRRRPVRRQARPPARAGGGRRAPSRTGGHRAPIRRRRPGSRSRPSRPAPRGGGRRDRSRCSGGPSGGVPARYVSPRWRRRRTRRSRPPSMTFGRPGRSLRDATLEGEPSADLATRVTRLEAKVRNRTMQAGAATPTAAAALDVAGLRDRLHDSSLVELVALEGRLLAVTLAGGRAQLHRPRAQRARSTRRSATCAPRSAAGSPRRRTSTGPTARPGRPEPPPPGSTTWCSRR